jgi:septation ring formation regulator EzrA
MTTNDIITFRDNKHYCFCDHEKEIKEVKDQINCIQKSVANLRKDIPELVAKRIQERKRSRIHKN